jgi:hypothetical protein
VHSVDHLRRGYVDVPHGCDAVVVVLQADVVQPLEEVVAVVLDGAPRGLADQRGLVREPRNVFVPSELQLLVLVRQGLCSVKVRTENKNRAYSDGVKPTS